MTSFSGSQAAQADDLTPTSVKAGDQAGYRGVKVGRYGRYDVHVIRMVGRCWKLMVHGVILACLVGTAGAGVAGQPVAGNFRGG